jgi:hypothetical protein
LTLAHAGAGDAVWIALAITHSALD